MNHISFAAEPYLPYQRVITCHEEVSSHCLDDRQDHSDSQRLMAVVTL